MAQEGALDGSSSVVASGSATSGLNVSLHPLPILNISDHCTRTRHAAPGSKIVGALLGTQANRDLSIVNSFELTYSANAQSGPSGTSAEDVNMDGPSAASGSAVRGQYILDAEFLETRKEQFKQVFPTLDVVGWYSVGQEPDADDISLHAQFATDIDSPIFLFFDPASTSSSNQELPFRVFESALAEGATGASGDAGSNAQFVQLEYGVETGEAERIAVDGVTRGGMEGDGESAVVSNLTTQRNAIKMLSDRIAVVVQYIADVAEKKVAEPDHTLLRQISSLVAALPTIDAIEFKQELHTEFEDVQLTQYLSDLTRQLNTLDEYTDKHHHLYPEKNEREPGFGGGSFGGGFGGRGVMAGGPAGGRNARTKGRH